MTAGRIQRLDELTINKIAAGEVIENPASVVKELVENSLDAASTDICVEILGGGRDLIRISDNGCGMNREDALLSIERYATSKISSAEDIFRVRTMGFRGEALASIASVAKVTLITALHPSTENNIEGSRPYGTLLLSEAGKIISCSNAIRDPGTTVEVKSLFFNLPVRKKFLRSPAYDAQEIHRVLGILAMANPSIHFRLISNEKILLNTPIYKETQQMVERLKDVLGVEFSEATYPITGNRSGYNLEGVISQANYTRPNRTGQYLFINKRAVTSPLVAQAIREGYGTALADGRHPLWVIYLTVPEGLVDVNVHPQKKEVRLRQQELLRELLIEAIRAAMQRRPPPSASLLQQRHADRQPTTAITPAAEPKKKLFSSPPPFERAIIEQIIREEPQPPHSTTVSSSTSASAPPPTQPLNQIQESFCNPIHILAVLPSYLLLDPLSAALHPAFQQAVSAEGGLLLLDIKAAQGRIFFEELVKKTNMQRRETQMLLIPAAVELTSAEASIFLAHKIPLQERGIRVRQTNEKTFIIEAMPEILTNLGPSKFLRDLIHELLEEENNGERYLEKQWESALARAAMRRASTSDAKNLSLTEADALVKQLLCCALPTRTPIGGATLIQISEKELINRFNK